MPNIKDFVDALTALTAPVAGDLVYVRNAAGNRKMTVQNLLNGVNTLPIDRRDGGDIGGYLCDGDGDYITVADNANLDFGLSDLSIEMYLRLADYTPAVELVLLEKHASNLGYKLFLTTAGKLKLQFGNGTDFTTFSYESAAVGVTDGDSAHFLVTIDRSGNALFYVDGLLNATVDVSGSIAQTLDNTGAFNIFGNGSSYTSGKIYIVRAYNKVLTSSDIQSIYNNNRPDLHKLPLVLSSGVVTPVYSSDFSTEASGFAGIRGTISVGTASEDGVSDGVTSYDNVCSFYADASDSNHFLYTGFSGISPLGKRFIEKFKIYIPTANTNVDGIGFQLAQSESNTLFVVNSLICTKIVDGSNFGTISGTRITAMDGFWAQVTADITLGAYSPALGFFLFKATSYIFTGANSASDDLVHIYDYSRTIIGNCLEYLPINAGSLGWIESSGNQLSGSTSGSPICLTKEVIRPPHYRDIKKSIAADTNTTLTGIVPRGYKIVSIRAKGSDSLADIKIGSSSAGEQIVAATTTSSTTPKLLTLAATANDAYSESADVTLYARHDTSASGKTMDLIFHFEKVGN